MNCPDFKDHLHAYLADSLEGVEAAVFREHLQSCSTCREEAVSADPVLLLSTVPLAEPSAVQVDACVAAVSALIHQDRLQQRMSRPRWRWMAAAAVVVMSVSAGVAWWSKSPGVGEGTMPSSPGEASVAVRREEPPPPRVEVEAPGGDLRVFHYADAGDGNTAVVYIVKESLEL